MAKSSSPQQFALLAAVLAAGVTVFATAAVQQNYRQSANDPQIQLARDGADALGRSLIPSAIVGDDPQIDAGSSLAPFVTVYDTNQHVLATSGQFNGDTLTPPAGAFDYAKAHGEDRFTWATSTGVREAAVLVYQSSGHAGYVLSARNLLEVEKREDSLRLMSMLTLAAIVLVAGGYALLVR